MSDLGDFIATIDGTPEEMASDILTFLRASGAAPEPVIDTAYEPTMKEIMFELTRASYKPGDGSGYSRGPVRSETEIDKFITDTITANAHQNVRLSALQEIRAAEKVSPSWWRKALGLTARG